MKRQEQQQNRQVGQMDGEEQPSIDEIRQRERANWLLLLLVIVIVLAMILQHDVSWESCSIFLLVGLLVLLPSATDLILPGN